ncbi:aromatic ring-hydroxylating oxygenase subunit alpha [Nannocystis pusilla]|uniref:aromatic ring-hydroxylating oxygenase subunit alpha n=1 Tax=Nannocystis pusilla TaxID=889268 RepID=UPI003BF16E11
MSSRFPFTANPIGWFMVAYSDELKPAGVMPLHYFGRELVLFRGQDGVARVLDAHCPHLGAHLGHGGCVIENNITCPFHGWRFDGSGSCVGIPYAKKIPPAAMLRRWPVSEKNGMIFVHHAPDESYAPTWEVPALAEHESQAWTGYARRRWRVRTNVHEIVENAFDVAHFCFVHGAIRLPESKVTMNGPLFQVNSHTAFDTPAGVMEGDIDIDTYGFGMFTARYRGLIEGLIIASLTPIDDEFVDVRFTFTVKRVPDEAATAFVAQQFMEDACHQLEQDIAVWEHKRFLARPLLCEGDGPIGLFRKWARQFYPVSTLRARAI